MARPLSIYMAGSCAQLIDDLRAPFARIAPGTELVSARVGMTGTVVAEILGGAPADAMLSANRAYMDQLQAAGLAPNPVRFAGNRLALFVSPNAVEKVHGLADLTRPDVTTVVMPPDDDPCGAYTAALFARMGMNAALDEQRRSGRLIVLDPRNPDAFTQTSTDVRILYRSVARRMPELTVVELPESQDMHDAIEFVAGAIERNGETHPDAVAFVTLLTSPEGQAILAAHEFVPIGSA